MLARIGFYWFICCMACTSAFGGNPHVQEPYNIVIILTDDLGYGDLGCFGGNMITPSIERLAREGRKFMTFYASPICSPSRSALLTGCYPQRIGIPSVISGKSNTGINPDEKLLPEMLKEQGYRTALFGKWHLGNRKMYFPQHHGFDRFYGTLASNDDGVDMSPAARRYGQAGLLLFDDLDTVAVNPRQWELTRRYTDHAVDFIGRNKESPFFLYLAFNAPHTPLFVGNEYAGKSENGIYHDVVLEIDGSVGRIMQALEANNLRGKTMIVFLSDNGPWRIFGNHGGSATPFSGSKKQTLEGGVRVPFIVSLPGVIPADTECSEMTTIMDLYPTIAALTGATPTRKVIDGKNILALMKTDSGLVSPHKAYYYYYQSALQGIRAGRYKLQLPHHDFETPDPDKIGYDGHRGAVKLVTRPLALYDLEEDPAEEHDISRRYPNLVEQLLNYAREARQKFGDSITGIDGTEIRRH